MGKDTQQITKGSGNRKVLWFIQWMNCEQSQGLFFTMRRGGRRVEEGQEV
jgi:hypothetical protein